MARQSGTGAGTVILLLIAIALGILAISGVLPALIADALQWLRGNPTVADEVRAARAARTRSTAKGSRVRKLYLTPAQLGQAARSGALGPAEGSVPWVQQVLQWLGEHGIAVPSGEGA
jgi:hypothetical protein